MTDRELLESAAKAAGMHAVQWVERGELLPDKSGFVQWMAYRRAIVWNPLEDDGDAFRLAVKLDLLLMPYPLDKAVRVTRLDQPDTIVSWGTPPDQYAATRRAIVRAAAAMAPKTTAEPA